MKYCDFLKGKKVAVVGPSQSSIGSELGPIIDSYDIVVRLISSAGNSVPVKTEYQKDIGKKTDVLYTNFDRLLLDVPKVLQFKEVGVKFINCTRPTSELFGMWNRYAALFDNAGMLYNPVETSKYNKWTSRMKCSPHSGFCSILDLLTYDIEELFVVGFSFYKDNAYSDWPVCNGMTYEKYIEDVAQVDHDSEKVIEYSSDGEAYINLSQWTQEIVHNNEKEFLFFKHEILKKDKRVVIAKPLEHFFR